MEGFVLDDAAFHLRECGGEELFAGGKGKAALFLYDRGCAGFHLIKIAVQWLADAGHEPAEPGAVPADAGRSVGEGGTFSADERAWRDQSEPGVHVFGGYRGAGAAKCGVDGHIGFPAGDTAAPFVEQDLDDSLRCAAERINGYGSAAGGVRCDDRRVGDHTISIFVEGLACLNLHIL